MGHYAIQFFLYSLLIFVHFLWLVVCPLSLCGVVSMSPFSRPIYTVQLVYNSCKCASAEFIIHHLHLTQQSPQAQQVQQAQRTQ